MVWSEKLWLNHSVNCVDTDSIARTQQLCIWVAFIVLTGIWNWEQSLDKPTDGSTWFFDWSFHKSVTQCSVEFLYHMSTGPSHVWPEGKPTSAGPQWWTTSETVPWRTPNPNRWDRSNPYRYDVSSTCQNTLSYFMSIVTSQNKTRTVKILMRC